MNHPKIVWILGGSGGIGGATALLLASEGYRVALGYYDHKETAEAVCRSIAGRGGEAAAVFSDVTDPASMEQAYRQVTECLGAPEALVYAAGRAHSGLIQDTEDSLYRNMMGVNLDGAFYACRLVLPEMIRRKEGAIVLVSSMWGQIGGSCEVIYSAAKAGIIGLTKALAKEVAPSGIRVNCLAPGVVLTEMVRPLGEETLSALAEETPMGRNGNPEEMAQTVSFLLSEKSSFITGQVVGVNGGLVV